MCLGMIARPDHLTVRPNLARDGDSLNTSAPHSQPSSPAKAGDPVFRDVSDGSGKLQRTGYSAFAEYDGLCIVTVSARRQSCESSPRQILQQKIQRRACEHVHVGEAVGAAGLEGHRGRLKTCDADAAMAGGVA